MVIHINIHKKGIRMMKMQTILKVSLFFMGSLGVIMLVSPTYANCNGCLCPGDPCNLCAIPVLQDTPLKPNESELCARIREKIPPIAAQPGSNEYFSSLDRSTMICVSEGGDVIRNRQRNAEFPSRFYCKPPNLIKEQQ